MASFSTGIMISKSESERRKGDEVRMRRQGLDPSKGVEMQWEGAVVSRRQHKVSRVDKEAEKDREEAEALPMDPLVLIAKPPQGRMKWMHKAMVLASKSRTHIKIGDIYEIIMQDKFISGVPRGVGAQMKALLFANFHLFSSKQQRSIKSSRLASFDDAASDDEDCSDSAHARSAGPGRGYGKSPARRSVDVPRSPRKRSSPAANTRRQPSSSRSRSRSHHRRKHSHHASRTAKARSPSSRRSSRSRSRSRDHHHGGRGGGSSRANAASTRKPAPPQQAAAPPRTDRSRSRSGAKEQRRPLDDAGGLEETLPHDEANSSTHAPADTGSASFPSAAGSSLKIKMHKWQPLCIRNAVAAAGRPQQ